ILCLPFVMATSKTIQIILNLKTVFLLSLTPFVSIEAQKIEGVYRMTGGHEMVAAFQFKPDSTYQFYFIYGAVDRKSSGRFSIHDGNIILHAVKVPGNDFTILREEKRGEGTSIKISHQNSHLLRNVLGIFKKGAEQDQQFSNNEGYIHSDLKDCDSVFVIHTLFPDVP